MSFPFSKNKSIKIAKNDSKNFMIIYFTFGLTLGSVLTWFLYFSKRREIVRLEEEKQLLQQEKHTVIEFTHNLVQAISGGAKRAELYQKIVHSAILSTGALSACLFELNENKSLTGVSTEGLFPPQKPIKNTFNKKSKTRARLIEKILQSESFELGEGLIGSVATSQKAILIANAEKDPRVVKHQDPALAVKSIIIAPILFRKNLLGVLSVANPADSIPFDANDLSLVESLAEQAGMAIHNANLMNLLIEKKKLDFDLSLASNIQRLLLPRKFPENRFLQIDAYYQPAQKVGGDLYDVFSLPGNKVGLAIADVSGKGVPASILMAICQTNLRHFARKHTSPSEVLKAINFEMHPEIRHDMFITITYAVLDTLDNKITLARAGHELPLLFKYNQGKTDYTIEKISSPGMALGMVPSEIFDTVIKDVSVNFDPGDAFVLYTDGITEATNVSDEEFGIDRLHKHLSSSLKLSPKDANRHVIDALVKFSGTTKNIDDLTLVSVKHIN